MTILNISLASSVDFKAHFSVNGKKVIGMEHVMLMPGKPTLIEVYFTDPRSGQVYKDFKLMHGKLMHMVISSKDLSVFKHVHPYFEPSTGRFSLTLNMKHSDPDNVDTEDALSKPGMYMIMTDVIVKGIGMRMDHMMAHVHGSMDMNALKLDPANGDGSITKFFKREDEKTPLYKTNFRYESTQGQSGKLVRFEISMEYFNGNEYVELLDFQPWLSEAAHSVWLSSGYMDHMHHDMPFAHMHSPFVLDDDDDDTNDRVMDNVLRFNFHDKNIMLPGKQKMWIQFKHDGKIMKIPFIFSY